MCEEEAGGRRARRAAFPAGPRCKSRRRFHACISALWFLYLMVVLLRSLLVSNDRSASDDFSDAEASEELRAHHETRGQVAVGPGRGVRQLLVPQSARLRLDTENKQSTKAEQ